MTLHTPSLRAGFAYLIISLFILFFLASGTIEELSVGASIWDGHEEFQVERHGEVQVIKEEEFAPKKRVLIVGDVHGMFDELQSLLSKVSYDEKRDTLVHVGDIVSKGTHEGSMKTLRWMMERNITGVRGNHDDRVLEIRGKMHLEDDLQDLKKNFPEHWKIAKEMSSQEHAYLRNLPLRIHVPSAHVFIVHAGLLASDPRRRADAKGQPLATLPRVSEERLRTVQEQAILRHVPQNTVAWNTLNMRGVKKNGKVTKDGKEGRAWPELWNHDMDKCGGFNGQLPCRPSTVVYGHAASRGLDVRRWTIGLDTGCAYGRKLTALVLDGEQEDLKKKKKESKIKFGDEGMGELVHVKCSLIR